MIFLKLLEENRGIFGQCFMYTLIGLGCHHRSPAITRLSYVSFTRRQEIATRCISERIIVVRGGLQFHSRRALPLARARLLSPEFPRRAWSLSVSFIPLPLLLLFFLPSSFWSPSRWRRTTRRRAMPLPAIVTSEKSHVAGKKRG